MTQLVCLLFLYNLDDIFVVVIITIRSLSELIHLKTFFYPIQSLLYMIPR